MHLLTAGGRVYLLPMYRRLPRLIFALIALAVPLVAHGQIDPAKRRLIQLGYNQALQGREPIAAYGFFYLNQPHFYSTNLTLRLAISPLYLDSELGFSHLLGPNTDLGVGLAGGGFADSYAEFRRGKFEPKESFLGDGGEISGSIYHLFNPERMIPLYLVLRTSYHQSYFRRESDTARAFEIPEDRGTVRFRTGLRFGGEEPSLTEPMAMELSAWHEGQYRTESGKYGFGGDREVEPCSQLLWARALLKFALEPSEQMFQAGLSTGTTWEADRFSAYRLGGILPFSSEFPLSIPGYYFQELSARRFGLLNAQYSIPIPPTKSWRFNVLGAAGWVDYLAGLQQPGRWHAGAGAGVTYISPSGSWLATVLYGRGFEALRTHGRGADEIALLFQYDFEAKARGKSRFFIPGMNPWRSRAAEEIFR
jgi:hypothetical protein